MASRVVYLRAVHRHGRRYWEHTIRDEADLAVHVAYVHINPLKHGLVTRVADWPWSTFHREVRAGRLPMEWGGDVAMRTLDVGEPPRRVR